MVNQYKQQFDSMMQREVSRSDFLKVVGVVLLGFVGVIGFLKNLQEAVPASSTRKKQLASGGYGRSAYGR